MLTDVQLLCTDPGVLMMPRATDYILVLWPGRRALLIYIRILLIWRFVWVRLCGFAFEYAAPLHPPHIYTRLRPPGLIN